MPPTQRKDPGWADEPDFLHQPGESPIPGYRLIEPLGRGGFGEVWKCEAPGGLHKAMKFVQGGLHAFDSAAPADEEWRAIERIKSIRHPFLLSMERVERIGNDLVVVLELADRNLADVLAACKAEGMTGIARETLLAYLREAAEALDVLNQRHGLQHLDIKPQNLFVLSNHVKVGDFGLVQNMAGGRPNAGAGAITPLYASPEVFQGSISPHSDQYSLAIVYMELLTGQLPFTGKNGRQLMLQHVQVEPELSPLPEADRPAVARALSKSPSGRFPSCADFLHALVSGQTEVTVAVPAAETRTASAARTRKSHAAPVRSPLPSAEGGLEMLELAGRTPLTETWKARAPDGSPRLVTVAFGCAGPGDPAIATLGRLRHPGILPIEVVAHTSGRLVLCQGVPERTLRELLAECQCLGLPGVPRRELLAHLLSAAEILHHFESQAGLRHLGLNLRVLGLSGGRLVIQNMGLAQLAWLPVGQNVAQLNARYSAPELVLRQPGPACDQYSLALIYHELLTGACPLPSKSSVPCLDALPPADRLLVARALNPDPERRWSGPLELFRALQAATVDDPADAARSLPTPSVQASGPGVRMKFGTNLAADVIRQRLEGFRRQWDALAVTAEERRLVFAMPAPASLWQRWAAGRRPMVEVTLAIGEPEISTAAGVQTRTEVRLGLTASGCTREQADELLKVQGPLLVESVRQHLQPGGGGRRQERLPWNHPLRMCPVLPDGTRGPAVDCQGKDISLNGIGFYVQGSLPGTRVVLLLPKTQQTPATEMSARVVRVQGCGDGWFEVGAVLLPPE